MLKVDDFVNAGKKETMLDPVKRISTTKVLPQAEVLGEFNGDKS
jgi:hypothetical protein